MPRQLYLFHALSEAATRGVLCKKLFLEVSQNSQENTCATGLQLFYKRESGTGAFREFWKISKNTVLTEHLHGRLHEDKGVLY